MKTNLFVIIVLILPLASCGLDSKGAEKPPAENRQSTPDSTAKALVEGMTNLNCEAIAEQSTGSLNDYYVALGKFRDLLAEVAAELVSIVPGSKDAPTLVKMRDAWQKPMLNYGQMRIDGRLKSEDPATLQRYRISWSSDGKTRVEDVLTMRMTDGQWRVESIGDLTPTTEFVGGLKSQFNLLKFSYKDALKEVRKRKPTGIVEAQTLFSKIRSELIEGG